MDNCNKILYDYQAFQMQKFGGISRYFYELATRLNYPYEIALRFSINAYIKNLNIPSQIPINPRLYKLFLKDHYRMNKTYAIKRIKQHRGIFHPTYYYPYFLDFFDNKKYVVTVHDMIHERHNTLFGKKDKTSLQKKQIIDSASHIIAISEHTKHDLIEIFGTPEDKITVIYHGTETSEHPLTQTLQLPEKYILYVGDRTAPYKNFHSLLEAFRQLVNEDKNLYLFCTGKPFSKAEKLVFTEKKIATHIRHQEVTDDELRQLYTNASAFVYPSKYEGFGIPILEAFKENCPVVLSRASCFPEIAGDAAAYFNPDSPNDIASTLYNVLHDSDIKEQLVKIGRKRLLLFSWDDTVRKTERIYNML